MISRNEAIRIIIDILKVYNQKLGEWSDIKSGKYQHKRLSAQTDILARHKIPIETAMRSGIDRLLNGLSDELLSDMLCKCVIMATMYGFEIHGLPGITKLAGTDSPFIIRDPINENSALIYTDQNTSEIPRTSIMVLAGYASIKGKYTDRQSIVGVRLMVIDGLQLTLYPNTKIQMEIDSIEKIININNKSNDFIDIDLTKTIKGLVDFIGPMENIAKAIDREYSESGLNAALKLAGTLFETAASIIGSIAVGPQYINLTDFSQPLGEALAGDTIDNIKIWGESVYKALNARIYLKTPENIEIK
jgi:hypothetical protein